MPMNQAAPFKLIQRASLSSIFDTGKNLTSLIIEQST